MKVDNELITNIIGSRAIKIADVREAHRRIITTSIVAWLRREARKLLLPEMTPSQDHYRLLDLADKLERGE